MSDRYERECEREEKRQNIEANSYYLAEQLRELFPTHKKYQKIKSDLAFAGYRVEECDDHIKIWKQI